MKRKMDGHNYIIFTNGTNLVKVGSTYAKKLVYGYAKCAPEDEFDLEKGIEIAKSRCDLRIAEKRYNELTNKHTEILKLLKELTETKDQLEEFIGAASHELLSALEAVRRATK